MKRFPIRLASPVLAALLVVVVGTAASVASWKHEVNQDEKKISSALQSHIDDFVNKCGAQLGLYAEATFGIAAYASNEEITQPKLRAYINSIYGSVQFKATKAIAYAPVVKKADVAAFEQKMHAEGNTNYKVQQTKGADEFVPIAYLASFTGTAPTSYGFDYLSEPTRARTLTLARDSGIPTISDSVVLLRDQGKKNPAPSVLLVTPVYKGTPPITVAQRRQQVKGYVLMSINVKQFLDPIKDQEDNNISFAMYDGSSVDKSKIMYGNYMKFTSDKTKMATRPLPINGKNWTIAVVARHSLSSEANRGQSNLVLALGLLLTAILASFLLYVVNSKSRELEFHKQLDVQSAKDSLLSLASHQLRTPATGVKQYVGMVLEGYAGDISDEQRTMLHKANESNERQLSIINQILRLSRLETERIILNKASTNIGELVHDVVSEQQHQLQNKRISILVTEDDIHADVDEPYFRMVIENLVSNAAKYSREKANIAIHVSKTDADLILKVTDDGIGIPQEDFDKLFKLFTRLDNEMSLQVGGTGIGLYIDKLIVDLHGGQISVESEVGKGSTFTVTVPLRVSSGDLVL